MHAAPVWLARARAAARGDHGAVQRRRWGILRHAADAEQLYTRPQDPTDNATPWAECGSSCAATDGRLTGLDRYAARAERAAASAGELVRRLPRFAGWLLADAIGQT